MKWGTVLLINIALFIGCASLSDLWWLEKSYSHSLVPYWLAKGSVVGGIFTLFFWWPRKKQSA